MSEDALMIASSSHPWLHYIPSVSLENMRPKSKGDFTEEESLAHDIAGLKLRKYCIEPIGARSINASIKKLKERPQFQEEMLKHTDIYIDYIAGVIHSFSSLPYVAAEKKCDYSSYVPEGFGTGDCIIIGGNILHIIDFDYGREEIPAKDNPQMMLHALGAYNEYAFLYPIDTVKITIIQPRLDIISEDTILIENLLLWGEYIKQIQGGMEYGKSKPSRGSDRKG